LISAKSLNQRLNHPIGRWVRVESRVRHDVDTQWRNLQWEIKNAELQRLGEDSNEPFLNYGEFTGHAPLIAGTRRLRRCGASTRSVP